VAGDEREGDEGFEVAGRPTIHCGEVRSADSRESGPDADPVGAGCGGGFHVHEAEGPRRGAATGDEATGDPGGRIAGEVASELEGLHRVALPAGASGRRLRRMPGDLRKSSTSQPRFLAMLARRVSGLTATGNPTASSMGRSLAESA